MRVYGEQPRSRQGESSDSDSEQNFAFATAGVECTAGERLQRTPKPGNPSCEYGRLAAKLGFDSKNEDYLKEVLGWEPFFSEGVYHS